MKDLLYSLGFTAIVFALLFGIVVLNARQVTPGGQPEVKPDTVYIERTVTRDSLVYVTQKVVKHDTLFVHHTDTVHHPDTVYLPIVERYYEEEGGRLRLWVRGYNPELIRYELDERTQVITRTVKDQKHWGFSFTAGPAVMSSVVGKGVDFGLAIVGGLSYTF